MNRYGIGHISYENRIVLYWNRFGHANKKNFYTVYSENMVLGKTHKTHYEIKNLIPNTLYKFIVTNDRNQNKEFCIKTNKIKRKIDITQMPYNCIGDGQNINTLGLQKAIDDCDENSYVYIPSGTFLSGALRLHSNMELRLDDNAILKGTENVNDYLPKIKSRFEGIEMMCYSSLINIGVLDHNSKFNMENIIISGGKIIGGGKNLRQNIIDVERIIMNDYINELGDKINEYENDETIPGRARPRLINISNGKNITICNTFVADSPAWNIHYIYSEKVVIYGVSVSSLGISNGDGIDPDSSCNSDIFNCDFYTGDDGIAIKSGKNPEGNIINRPSKNINIFDCRSHYSHGLSIGSEISGGIENIHVWDCDFENALCGIQIKATKKRGGYVKKIFVENSIFSSITVRCVEYNDDGIPASHFPVFEDMKFSNIIITSIACWPNGNKNLWPIIQLNGFNEDKYEAKNIFLKNIIVKNISDPDKQCIILQNIKNVKFDNLNY